MISLIDVSRNHINSNVASDEIGCKLTPIPVTLDSDPVPTFVFNPCPLLNFGSGFAFGYDPGTVLDPALRHAFNSDIHCQSQF
ncbi:hypothetical protein EVAR_13403_1 [Eumeta japonica]|uniref:Uncharacterized protein n=1 Tax=Eumeta variegata TaxID=151549 RepID=A0A4C1V966_EUMVA|nr:hypothetical protein EVAR_13403_1 [Eumeta japonica]